MAEQETYEYLLFDDNGASHATLPVLLCIGSVFRHEYGTYKVIRYFNYDAEMDAKLNLEEEIAVECERIYKHSELSLDKFIEKSKNYKGR